MNILVTQNNAPVGHRLRNVIIDVEAPALAQFIFNATGGGMTAKDTAKAMETHQRLRALAIGESVQVKCDYLDMAMRSVKADVTFTRVED